MHRFSVITISACAALLLVTAVHAQQQPAAPASPPPPPPAYGAPITLEQAKAAVAAAEAEMTKNGWNMVIAVVGPGGNLVYLQKADLAANASVDIAQDKARTSALFRVPSKSYMDRLANGETFILRLTGGDACRGRHAHRCGWQTHRCHRTQWWYVPTRPSGRAGRRERCEIKNFTSQLQIRRDKIPAAFYACTHHIHLRPLLMTSPIVSSVAAHTKAETKFAT